MGQWRDGRGSRVRFPDGATDFLIFTPFRQTRYSTSTGSPSPEKKRPEHEANHSPSFTAEVRSGGATPPLLLYVFMAQWLNFIFQLYTRNFHP
jgi:hypothetical protein